MTDEAWINSISVNEVDCANGMEEMGMKGEKIYSGRSRAAI